METKIKTMCANGERDEAQQQALDYSREMIKRPVVGEMREYSELMRGMIAKMPFEDFENLKIGMCVMRCNTLINYICNYSAHRGNCSDCLN